MECSRSGYIQPEWLGEILATHQGTVAGLRDALVKEELFREEKLNNPDDNAIEIWTELCFEPIRRGEVNPLPYVQPYSTRNGKTTTPSRSHIRTYPVD